MAAQATTLSSAGVSTAIILNPVCKSTTVQLTVASAATATGVQIQFTLDDPTTTPAPTVSWANLSSAIASSVADGVGVIYTVLSPLGGLRISSSTTVSGAITLKSLQSVTA